MARIIVPTDFSATAEKALDQALLLAQLHNDEVELMHVVVLTPIAENPKIFEEITRERPELEERMRKIMTRRIQALGIEASARWRVKVAFEDSFYNTVIHRFRKSKAKLVVMGTTGVSGLADKIFGSNTANLIGKAEVPVLAIPPGWTPAPLQKLLFCLTPEQLPHHARSMKKWAGWFGAEVESLHFTAVPAQSKPAPEDSLFTIRAVESLPETPLYQDLVAYSRGLKNEALVLFVHERNFLERIFDRSITQKVAGYVQVPMLALPVETGKSSPGALRQYVRLTPSHHVKEVSQVSQ